MLNIVDAKNATKLLPYLASFAAVVEAGSYSAAARRMGVDKTLLSRRVRALEEGLGVRVLQRTTRRIALTEAGRELLDRTAQQLDATVGALSRAADASRLEGLVRIAGFSTLTDSLWVPIIRELGQAHPNIQIELRAGDRFIDLVDQRIDFALRAGRMPDSTFTARRVCTWGYVLCASPSWQEEHGDSIRSPEDTRGHWLRYHGVARSDEWMFERKGRKIDLRIGPAITVDNSSVGENLVEAGIAIAPFPTYHAARLLASGRFVRLLPEWRVAHTHGLWIVTPARDYVPTRVTVVIEAVQARLKELAPSWQALLD